HQMVFNQLMVKTGSKKSLAFDVFNALPDWVWLREIDGRILDINEAALRRTGYARAELVGKPISDFYFDPKDKPRSKAWTDLLLKEGAGYMALAFRDKKGRPIQVEQHGRIVDLGGRRACLIVARDSSEQHRQ